MWIHLGCVWSNGTRANEPAAGIKPVRRHKAIEPIVGHAKSDDRMDRRPLFGEFDEWLHAVLCVEGYNINWLLRMIRRKG